MLPTIREGAPTQVRHQERARTLPGGQARYEGRADAMCINHTGIKLLPEATYTGLRYPRSNSWNGTASERMSDNRG